MAKTLTILVIDDSRVARTKMAEVLSKRGHTVLDLPSAIGATQLILRKSVDVVVIDVNLPTVQGDRLAAVFRSNPRMNRVGVVLVSGIPRSELEVLAEQADADAVVTKEEIEARLADAVIRAAVRRAA